MATTSNLDAPLVSVLIATYNRSALLPRAIESVLKQDFGDFEIIIIDDCSTDDTQQVAAKYTDPRIRYIRNEENQGSKHGDRIHVRRAVYELMRGKYFVYLCDDDFWLPSDLLSEQIAAFKKYPSLSMAVGSHAHTYPADITQMMGPEIVKEVSPTTFFSPKIMPAGFMTGFEYLDLFAANPHGLNLLDGGTLWSREAFMKAQVFATDDGSRWQAGYEFKMGPAAIGDVFYIDKPCVIAGVEGGNASFRGTQYDHFLDCLHSVRVACRNVAPALDEHKKKELERIRRKFIRNITHGFILNRKHWRVGAFVHPFDHSAMFEKNVTTKVVLSAYARHGVPMQLSQFKELLWANAPLPLLKNGHNFYPWLAQNFGRSARRRLVDRTLRKAWEPLSPSYNRYVPAPMRKWIRARIV